MWVWGVYVCGARGIVCVGEGVWWERECSVCGGGLRGGSV